MNPDTDNGISVAGAGAPARDARKEAERFKSLEIYSKGVALGLVVVGPPNQADECADSEVIP